MNTFKVWFTTKDKDDIEVKVCRHVKSKSTRYNKVVKQIEKAFDIKKEDCTDFGIEKVNYYVGDTNKQNR